MTNLRRPLVSVVLPTHDRARSLEHAMRSVLEQSLHDLELIVVDDASTDDTANVVATFLDPRVVSLHRASRAGANAARNAGLRVAKGRFVAFQDSDDVWRREKLRLQVEAFERAGPRVGVVASALEVSDGVRVERRPAEGTVGARVPRCRILLDNPFGLPAMMLRKDLLDDLGGFDERMRRLQDWDLLVRALGMGAEILYLDAVHVDAGRSEDAISRDDAALLQAHRRVLRIHRTALEACGGEVLGAQLLRVGHLYMASGRPRRGRSFLRAAVDVHRTSRGIAQLVIARLGAGTYRAAFSAFRRVRGRLRGWP